MARVEHYSEATTLTPVGEINGFKLFEMGLMYSTGKTMPVNRIEAHKFFNLAALRGVEVAKDYRKDLSAEMCKDEIAAAQKAAREWLSSTVH